MSTSVDDRDPNNKPVTGYPTTGYPPPGQSSYQPNGRGGGGGGGGGNYHYSSAATTNYPPAGTSYPYTVPPPATYYNHNQNPYPPQQHPYYYNPQRATFLRRVIIAAITVFLIIGAITFITWLIIRPHLPDIRVDSASLSNFNVSTGHQLSTGNWDIGFTVRNPNKKMSIYYDRLDSSVFYGDEPLTQTALQPFFQEKKTETAIKGKYAISTFIDDRLLNRMTRDRSDGIVNYNVRMLVWVRFRSGIWRPRRRIMRVFCDNIKIGVSSNSSMNGNLIGGPKECDVNL